MLHFKNNIKKIRSLAGLNQAKFAELFGESENNWKYLETKAVKLDPALADKVARYAGISAVDLVQREIETDEFKIGEKSENRGGKDKPDYEAKYIELLERDRNELSDVIQGFKESQVNLASVLTAQLSTLSMVDVAFGMYLEHVAGGDPEKLKQLLQERDKRISAGGKGGDHKHKGGHNGNNP